jgi:SAM-dependent methyltransferase
VTSELDLSTAPSDQAEKYAYYFAATRPAFVTRLLERKHRSLFDLAVDGAGVRSVMEVGPGEGFFARACRDAGIRDYLALESSPTGVRLLREQGFAVREATLPPFPPDLEPVDLLYASHLVEHLPGPDAVLSFLLHARALLRPGGRLVLVYPDARWMRMDFWESDYTHQWPSTPRRVAQVARDAGLAVWQSHDCCLNVHGSRARALRLGTRLYPQRLLSAVDRSRADFWFRGKLLFVPDSLTILTLA